MIDSKKVINALPAMRSGKELLSALEVLPEYDSGIIEADIPTRLMALSDLYRLYVPSQMSVEIYSKLYLALLRSLQKKGTKIAVQQQYQNLKAIRQQEYNGIIGGSDSFTIIGSSGIGKSSAISRAVSLITEKRVIEVENPCSKIIPCVTVQCPFDSSVKGLLLEILRKVDEVLDGNYYQNALRARATTDMLIGSVSQVALNHIGMLIVDEIQNVANSKNGKSLIGALTQLINNSGISICMVGTPESMIFFEQAMQLARRSVGLQYNTMDFNGYFQNFCKVLFGYRYVKDAELTDAVTEWLYEHSAGVVSIVVSLVHDAQEMAILDGREVMDITTLNEAYQKRLSMLHGYIQPTIQKKSQTSKAVKKQNHIPRDVTIGKDVQGEYLIAELASKAKSGGLDIVRLLKEHMPVAEVSV